MPGAADASVGPRRASGGEVLLLVAALLLTPRLFVLAPLAGLLVAARPRSPRATFFTGLAWALVVISIVTATGLLERAVTAWALLTAAAFVMLARFGPARSLFDRAVLALGIGTAGAVGLLAALGVTWAGLERYAARAMAAAFTTLLQAAGPNADPSVLAPLQAQVPVFAALLPAQLAVGLLLGLALAWRWHEWTAEAPLGPPAGRLAELRFADEWVWAVILPLAALLFGATGAAWSLCANVLLLAMALYLVRGAAVVRHFVPHLGPLAAVLTAVAALLFAVVLAAALVALGLADVWTDFRRRAPATTPKDDQPWK